MTAQLDLMTSGRAMSTAALAAVTPQRPKMRERVALAIEAAGAFGLTAEEVEHRTGLRGSTVRPRLLELERGGRVVVAVARTRATRSGCRARVYVAAGVLP